MLSKMKAEEYGAFASDEHGHNLDLEDHDIDNMRKCIREFMADANLQDVGMQEDSFQTLVGCTLVRHNRRPQSSVRFLPCWVLAPNLA